MFSPTNLSHYCTKFTIFSELGPVTAEIGWRVWGTPANFNGFHVLGSLLHRCHSTEVNQTLHVLWLSPGLVHYIYIFGGSSNEILPGAKFTLHPSFAFCYIGSITARHSSSGRAAIALGIAHILVLTLLCCQQVHQVNWWVRVHCDWFLKLICAASCHLQLCCHNVNVWLGGHGLWLYAVRTEAWQSPGLSWEVVSSAGQSTEAVHRCRRRVL